MPANLALMPISAIGVRPRIWMPKAPLSTFSPFHRRAAAANRGLSVFTKVHHVTYLYGMSSRWPTIWKRALG